MPVIVTVHPQGTPSPFDVAGVEPTQRGGQSTSPEGSPMAVSAHVYYRGDDYADPFAVAGVVPTEISGQPVDHGHPLTETAHEGSTSQELQEAADQWVTTQLAAVLQELDEAPSGDR